MIRIVTLNTRHGTDASGQDTLRAQAELIRAHLNGSARNIVLLQECDRGMARSGKVDQPKAFADLVGLPFSVFGANLRRAGGQYGTALLTDLALLETAHLVLDAGTEGSVTHIDGSVHGREPRGLLMVRLPGDLLVINVHASIFPEERLGMREDLRRIATEHRGPLLIGGDFNTDDPEEDLAIEGLTDAGGQSEPTFPSGAPVGRIDRFLLRGALSSGYRNVPTLLSDHHLLALDVHL